MTTKRKTLPKFSTEVLFDFGDSYEMRMPVAQWIALPDHPRERDTERQARKPHWKMARAARRPARGALRRVTAAELDQKLTKVDGHTRALLWSTGQLPDPEFVIATVYRCESIEELHELYDVFDSKHAAKKKFDSVTGAYREHGLELTSHRLEGGMIVDALSIAVHGVARPKKGSTSEDEFDISKAVKFFASELQLLDSAKPRSETYLSGVVSGALLALALDRDLIGFFVELAKRGADLIKEVAKFAEQGEELAIHVEQAERENVAMTSVPQDPVNALWSILEKRRLKAGTSGRRDPVDALLFQIALVKDRGSAELKHNEDLAGQTLRAAYAWKAGPDSPDYWFSGEIEPQDLAEAIREVRARKEGQHPVQS